jgi:hypothetical protein
MVNSLNYLPPKLLLDSNFRRQPSKKGPVGTISTAKHHLVVGKWPKIGKIYKIDLIHMSLKDWDVRRVKRRSLYEAPSRSLFIKAIAKKCGST